MDKLLTFSVASYNIEPYIEKLMSTMEKIDEKDLVEVLIVNDGSTDKTAERAREYETKYPEMVKLIDKENGGHGSTINAGIKVANGKYFKAIDGDDWINSDNFNKLITLLKKCDSDMILTDYTECYEDGKDVGICFDKLEDGKTYRMEEIAPCSGWMNYHSTFFKTSILKDNKISIDEHCFYVDREYTLYPIPHVKSVTYFSLPIYCYRLGTQGQSVSVESRIKHIDNCITVSESILDFYKREVENSELPKQTKEYVIDVIVGHLVWCVNSIMYQEISSDVRRQLKSYFREIKKCSDEIYSEFIARKRGHKLLVRTNFLAYSAMAKRRARVENR